MAQIKNLSCDIETYSSVDLAKSGVYRYIESSDFEILLFGYSVDGGEVQVIDLACGEPYRPNKRHAIGQSVTNGIQRTFNASACQMAGITTGQYLDPQSWRAHGLVTYWPTALLEG